MLWYRKPRNTFMLRKSHKYIYKFTFAMQKSANFYQSRNGYFVTFSLVTVHSFLPTHNSIDGRVLIHHAQHTHTHTNRAQKQKRHQQHQQYYIRVPFHSVALLYNFFFFALLCLLLSCGSMNSGAALYDVLHPHTEKLYIYIYICMRVKYLPMGACSRYWFYAVDANFKSKWAFLVGN